MISNIQELDKFYSNWLNSEDNDDPLIEIPISVIHQFRSKTESEMYLYVIKTYKEKIDKEVERVVSQWKKH